MHDGRTINLVWTCFADAPTKKRVTLAADVELVVVPGVCFQVDRDCSSVTDSPYRTFDGSCNNLSPGRENYGSIERAFVRFLPTAYDDGT